MVQDNPFKRYLQLRWCDAAIVQYQLLAAPRPDRLDGILKKVGMCSRSRSRYAVHLCFRVCWLRPVEIKVETIVHFHSATTKSQKQYSCSRKVLDLEKALDVDTGGRIQNTEKAINLDLGRQYLRKGTSAELCREFDCGSYTTVRLSNLGYRLPQEISEKLDKVGNLNQVPSVLELPDESWEMVVLKSYLLELENKLTNMFPGCDVDLDYDPTGPNREDIECLYITAKNPEPRAKSGEIATFIDVEDLKNFYVAAKARKVDWPSDKRQREGENYWGADQVFPRLPWSATFSSL